jgi:hypothetical protein
VGEKAVEAARSGAPRGIIISAGLRALDLVDR